MTRQQATWPLLSPGRWRYTVRQTGRGPAMPRRNSTMASNSNDSGNSFGARTHLRIGDRAYEVYRVDAVPNTSRLPYSLKVLLENMLRHEDGVTVNPGDIAALAAWDPE